MKRTLMQLLAITTLVLLPTIVSADECPTPDNKVHIGVETGAGIFNRYSCGVSGSTPFNKAVVQGYVKLTADYLGYQAYLKGWGSGIIIPDGSKKGGNEIDPLIAGIVGPIGPLKVGLGYGYYDLHPQFRGRGDLHGIFGTVLLPNKYVEPYFSWECDVPTAKKALEGGWYYRAGITKCFQLRKNLGLVLDLSVGGNDGAFGTRVDFFSFTRASMSLQWEPWKNFVVTPQIAYQMRLGHNPNQGGLCPDGITGGIEIRWRHDLLSF